ncbi:MAG: RHS repeat-associated core domain-containing protein, partial [Candidatus Omnitrophica bacterium]|nr:RHS repeat-associated core domain-containing protein [Candidatus Omnitrophota bacterium]
GGSNTYVHDEDGNLTSISGNKNVTYTYNAENRLVSAQPTTPVAGDKKVEFLYDYQGRRVQKIISSWNGSWTVDTTKHFVYDGWNVIQEITTAQPTKYYVWGLDLSQSLQGAGGVGGLLAMVSGLDSYTYMYDGNGNVGQMLNSSTGVIEAHYEYDPYGNETLATGALASSNPYRFSTKYLDDEFNLYYYGFRYYDPETGRWLNRDPIEEEGGGLNLYIFVGNNPINLIDILGLAEWKKEPSLQGPSFKSLGIMDPFEFWTIIPPSVGLGGEWFMISGSINGCAICDTCEEIDITLSLGKKVGIGIGLTFYPPLMYLRKGAKAFKGIKEAVKFYNNEWTQLAIDMGNSPDFWCTITPSIIEEAEAKYGNGDFEVSIRVEQKIIE